MAEGARTASAIIGRWQSLSATLSCVPGAPNVEPSSGFRLQFTVTVNRVQLIGNLGRDPEVRTTQSGGRVVTLSIATSESWKDERSGERRERTEWHRVVIFNEGLGKIAERYPGERREGLIWKAS